MLYGEHAKTTCLKFKVVKKGRDPAEKRCVEWEEDAPQLDGYAKCTPKKKKKTTRSR